MKPRRTAVSPEQAAPKPKYDFRFDWNDIWRRHQDFWSPERQAQIARFTQAAGRFHIQDQFRIVCDGQIDGHDCENVIGYDETFKFDTHDGLCQSCRAKGVDFPPRIHMTPDGVYAMTQYGPEIVPRIWDFPPELAPVAPPEPPKAPEGFATPAKALGMSPERASEIRKRLGIES